MFATVLTTAQSMQEIATDDRFSQMLKFFGIALVLVVPACVIVWRRAAKKAAADYARLHPEVIAEAEAAVPDPFDIKTVIADIDRTARVLEAGQSGEVLVPAALTLDGSPAPSAIVNALIGDAIARNRVQATWVSSAESRTVTLTR